MRRIRLQRVSQELGMALLDERVIAAERERDKAIALCKAMALHAGISSTALERVIRKRTEVMGSKENVHVFFDEDNMCFTLVFRYKIEKEQGDGASIEHGKSGDGGAVGEVDNRGA